MIEPHRYASKTERNRATRDAKLLTVVRRLRILLDLAAVDPIVEDEAGETSCLFCERPLEDAHRLGAHTAECVWRRAREEERAIRGMLARQSQMNTSEKCRAAAIAALGGERGPT